LNRWQGNDVTVDMKAIRAAAEAGRAEMLDFLSAMLRKPSFSGKEGPVQQLVAAAFAPLAETRQVPIHPAILADRDFVDQGQDRGYADRRNCLATCGGGGRGRSLILQSHTDVVAVEADWTDAFEPRLLDGGRVIAARGATDAKGCVATIWLVFRMLKELGITPAGRLEAQIVIEEEIGGNGALSLILDGRGADGVVVLESTQLQVHHANRGAVWFDVTMAGRAIHMGRRFEGVNAIEKMMKVIAALDAYEQRHIAESRGYPGFERYEAPVQLNVGRIAGGVGHSIVPGECRLAGGVGFLPNKSLEQVVGELHEAIRGIEDPWVREHCELTCTRLRNDSYEIDPAHPLPVGLAAAAREVGCPSEVFGWNVSCDARLYARRAGLPVVVFGPGDIAYAHSRSERIEIAQILDAAVCLVRFILQWCGTDDA
jgi:acetylornithine deacetylase